MQTLTLGAASLLASIAFASSACGSGDSSSGTTSDADASSTDGPSVDARDDSAVVDAPADSVVFDAKDAAADGSDTATPKDASDAEVSLDGAAPSIVEIGGGYEHTCARASDGRVFCWGDNGYAELGYASPTSVLAPKLSSGFGTAKQLAFGHSHTCVLDVGGTVFCDGRNIEGQLGGGGAGPSGTPGAAVLSDAIGVAAGGDHTCAVKSDGTVLCWGHNARGELGDGTTTNRSTPTPVVGLTGVAQVACGGIHTCARKTDGTVSCWGNDTFGELGDGGSALVQSTPVPVSGLSDAASIALGYQHSCALKKDGSVVCWGSNNYGQLGDGDAATGSVSSPVAVVSLGAGSVTQIALGEFHGCAVKTDATAVCWGDDNRGQLGDGAAGGEQTAPVNVAGLADVAWIGPGWEHTCAALKSGAAFCWGVNANAQLGDGTTTDRLSPTAPAW